MANKFKQIEEKGLVSTREAEDITSTHRISRDHEWNIDRASKADIHQQTYRFCSPLETNEGVTEKALVAEGLFSTGRATTREKLLISLIRNDRVNHTEERIVQLDVRYPVNRKGNTSDKNWPHIHFGKERILLEVEDKSKKINISERAKIFEKKANITFDPKLDDPNLLEL